MGWIAWKINTGHAARIAAQQKAPSFDIPVSRARRKIRMIDATAAIGLMKKGSLCNGAIPAAAAT
jgi:hypothetical protein